ncbi:hypothetical protein [Thalassomonas viridans]|nr:hypothetical protein [Thalassomonas viridans]
MKTCELLAVVGGSGIHKGKEPSAAKAIAPLADSLAGQTFTP